MNLPILATWLHEVGKFALLAGVQPPASANAEKPPTALLTAHFIENILAIPEDLQSSRAELIKLASALPNQEGITREAKTILEALRLAAGLNQNVSSAPEANSAKSLESIFSKLRLAGRGLSKEAPKLHYAIQTLNGADAIFPKPDAISIQDYQNQWQKFCEAAKKLPINMGLNAWRASLISLLERFCWCIPSETDLSLFDHAATSAAICQAMLACPQGSEVFLLYGGDLSGIQAFIFGKEQEGDKGAVRLLRARSFLLQAITRSLWLVLLERLNLTPAAKIMDAGGRFMLLLPNTPETITQLDTLEEEAETWLLKNFQGAVRMNFARLAITPDDLRKENFSEKFDAFNDRLEEAKLHPFSKIAKLGLLPFPPIDFSKYANGECDSCHARPKSSAAEDADCELCASLKRLGRLLPKTDFIAFSRQTDCSGTAFNKLLFGGINLHFYENLPATSETCSALEILSIKGKPIFTVTPIAGHVPEITADDLRKWQGEGLLSTIDGKRFFMGEECHEGAQKNFNMLAQAARIPPEATGQPWRSIAALGVCKADVDNLGLIFSMGFGDDFSLSRFAMLARMLNHFFSGWLMALIQKEYENLYVVFAGGDDVFVIGPWSDAISFACRMANEFARFCGNNPAASISCGLPVIKAGLPMRDIREEAEGALEQSKHFVSKKLEKNAKQKQEGAQKASAKNAITLFGQSAHWSDAIDLLEFGQWLFTLCEEGALSQGFIRRLLGYSRECREFLKGKDMARNGLYIPHLNYDLSRNWNRMTKKTGDWEKDPDLLRIKSLAGDKDRFSKSEMGISWALYRSRTSS